MKLHLKGLQKTYQQFWNKKKKFIFFSNFVPSYLLVNYLFLFKNSFTGKFLIYTHFLSLTQAASQHFRLFINMKNQLKEYNKLVW